MCRLDTAVGKRKIFSRRLLRQYKLPRLPVPRNRSPDSKKGALCEQGVCFVWLPVRILRFWLCPHRSGRETQYAIVDGTLGATDVDGALCVPLDPVDIGGFNPAINNLKIIITWKMAGAVLGSSTGYRMADRVGGTCLDFDVDLVIE